jgi:transposase
MKSRQAMAKQYITVVSDLVRGRTLWVGKERTAQTLEPFFQLLGPERCARIECISMDMWRPFALACRRHIPDARQKTVLDRFHIERHVGEAVDETRKQENRQLLRQGDSRLKSTRWEWMWNPENMPASRKERFETLRKSDLNTAKAYAMRLNLRRLWSMSSESEAREHFMDWHAWATHSNIRPMQRLAKKLMTHLDRILTYIRFRQTNGLAEGINNKIQTVIKKAYGFRNVQRLINMIYFHCGKLHMYPYPP